MRARTAILTIAVIVVFACVASPAFGYDEPAGMPDGHQGSVIDNCAPCHAPGPSGAYCDMCHAPHMGVGLSAVGGKGPHGFYTSTTNRCGACHEVHDAVGAKLLPAVTITDSCNTCHDGTGGKGVYGAIAAKTGSAPASMHSVDTTTVVPGGNASTGGSATMVFGGPGSTLTCGDCHSPHDSLTVAPYMGERWRASANPILQYNTKTSHLLRQHPGDSTVTVGVYGSDWCAACHAGRVSGAAVHNHPVDSMVTTTTPFRYDYVAKLSSDGPTSVTTTGTLARTNRGYLMPYPRTAQQGAHKPICQQCHEDARNVGTLADATGTAAAYVISSSDGATATDNPRFQNFPHEAQNADMLVETGDNLCLNCHPVSQLP